MEGRSLGPVIPQIGSVASGGFQDQRGWRCEAQSGAGEAGDAVGGALELAPEVPTPHTKSKWTAVVVMASKLLAN